MPTIHVPAVHKDSVLKDRQNSRANIAIFGHFGQINIGNESTLYALLYHLRRRLPGARVTCICTHPQITADTYHVAAVSMKGILFKPSWLRGNPVARLLRKLVIGIPSEIYRWLAPVGVLRHMDMLVVAGTGLLTDAYGFISWGPYNLFRWTLMAKLCGCKIAFVSVGAGPFYLSRGKFLTRAILAMANFRSYRDSTSMDWLRRIGFQRRSDRVYPDLAFSLPEALVPHPRRRPGRRRTVGLGLMEYAGRLSVESPSNAVYQSYLAALQVFVRWLLEHDYDVRLLIGDISDKAVTQEFKAMLKQGVQSYDEERVIDEPIDCVEDLLSQLAMTDLVVATRFHNVLLSLFLDKPVLSIAFHHKCVSLMGEMGLSKYSLDINELKADELIDSFCDLEKNAEEVQRLIKKKRTEFRDALEDQYETVFASI